MSGAHEDAPVAGAQGRDVTGPAEILGIAIVGDRGAFTAEQVAAHLRESNNHYAPVTLVIMAIIAENDIKKERNWHRVENIGLYWHFVDIIWIFLFPLMYIAK